jgi:penicillin V acylase-like amidase (Ntn superfamily)
MTHIAICPRPAPRFTEVAALLLGGCKTVDDAVTVLDTVTVLGNDVPTADRSHWSIVDAQGGSLVLEFTDGKLQAHDNSQIATMTNDPDYTWHLRNLNNYASLSTAWPVASYAVETDLTPNSAVPSAVGHGFNLMGMPGQG